MLNPLTPYMAWIKLGAAATALAVSFLGGCHVQAKRDTGKLDKAKADKAKSDKRAASLEQQLQAERAGCVDAGRRICGIPLQ